VKEGSVSRLGRQELAHRLLEKLDGTHRTHQTTDSATFALQRIDRELGNGSETARVLTSAAADASYRIDRCGLHGKKVLLLRFLRTEKQVEVGRIHITVAYHATVPHALGCKAHE
jgi:hypothetical protein